MNLLQREREARGLSLSEVARRAQMRTTKLWKLEHLELRLKVEDVPRLARAIGCEPLALIPTEPGQPAPPGPQRPGGCRGPCALVQSVDHLVQQAVEGLLGLDGPARAQYATLLALLAEHLATLAAALAGQAARPLRHRHSVRARRDAAGHG